MTVHAESVNAVNSSAVRTELSTVLLEMEVTPNTCSFAPKP